MFCIRRLTSSPCSVSSVDKFDDEDYCVVMECPYYCSELLNNQQVLMGRNNNNSKIVHYYYKHLPMLELNDDENEDVDDVDDEDDEDNKVSLDYIDKSEELMDNSMVNCNNNYSFQLLMMEDDNNTTLLGDRLDNTLANVETIELKDKLECLSSSLNLKRNKF